LGASREPSATDRLSVVARRGSPHHDIISMKEY
jgi:hypothetical protein